MMSSLLRTLHILPNEEILRREREESEKYSQKKQNERQERLREAELLKQRIEEGRQNAPLTLDAFLRAAGISDKYQDVMKERREGPDDKEQ